MLKIVTAETNTQFRQVRELTAELTKWDTAQAAHLGLDAQEVRDFYYSSGGESLSGVYARPEGRMLLATYSAKLAGCGGFRQMTPEICELKRMYVRPECRHLGIGRQLGESLVDAAREAGYRLMRLETTTFMDKALSLYASLSFRPCKAYYQIPESFRAYTIFMDLDLTAPT